MKIKQLLPPPNRFSHSGKLSGKLLNFPLGILFFLLPFFLGAQESADTLSLQTYDSIFSTLELNRIPHGLLLDRAIVLKNPQLFDGSPQSRAADIIDFSLLYNTLLLSQVDTSQHILPPKETFENNWMHDRRKYNQARRGTLVLGGLYLKYAQLDSLAEQNGKIRMENMRLYDVYENGVWQNPYVEKEVFVVVPPVGKLQTDSLRIVFPESLFISNAKKEIQRLEVDLDDGEGFRDITRGQTVSPAYKNSGHYTWRFRLTLNNGRQLWAYTTFTWNNPANSQDADEVIRTVPGATIRIKYAPSHNHVLVKPLIVAEGFDAGSYLDPEDDKGDLSINQFISNFESDNESGRLHELLYDPQEYDIVYVDWTDGTADIFDNAEVLKNVIEWVNQHRRNDPNNVVLGQSMGGLVARIALRQMEDEGRDHQTRLFIAHDSPFLGADVPLGFQYGQRYVQRIYIRGVLLLDAFFVTQPIFYYLFRTSDAYNTMNQYRDSIERFFGLLDRPAAQQMLYYRIGLNDQLIIDPHLQFLQQLNNIGYPQETRNVAISNGHECAVNQGFTPGDKYFEYSQDTLRGILYSLDFWSNPDIHASNRKVFRLYLGGSWVIFGHRFIVNLVNVEKCAPYGIIPYDNYSGGYYPLTGSEDVSDELDDYFLIDHYGFIPVPSALDIHKNGGDLSYEDYLQAYGNGMPSSEYSTPFDNYIVDFNRGVNRPHITFQSRNGDWLADEMENPPAVAVHCGSYCDLDENTEIEGSNFICNSENYSVPGAEMVRWLLNDTYMAHLSSPEYAETATVVSDVADASGPGHEILLTGIIDNECVDSLVLTKRIWVGNPSFGIQRYGNCGMVELELTNFNENLQGVTDIVWEVTQTPDPQGNLIIAEDGSTATAYITSSAEITVTAYNDCGSFSTSIQLNCDEDYCQRNEYDLLLQPIGSNKYQLYDPCYPSEQKYFSEAELYDQYGVKIGDLVPENENKEVSIPAGQPGQIRIIKALSQDGKLARRFIVVN